MSTLALILIIALAVVLLALLGGFLAARKRARVQAPAFERNVLEADQALEAARASDRGWDRATLDRVAREALAREQPGMSCEELLLVLVDDKPGVEEDRAQFVALGAGEEVRLTLGRAPGGEWRAEFVGAPTPR